MFYRRKIALALLELFGNELAKTDYQKLLMMVSELQKKPSYEFVPYKYGCFSFLSYSDISTMIKYDLVAEDQKNKKWKKVTDESYYKILKKDDQLIIEYIHDKFKNKLGKELIRYTYLKYPYYAINSTIINEILSCEEARQVDKVRKIENSKCIATIGYEGISLEEYINRLIKADIKLLVDVRRNPLSMKTGFSKRQLMNACNAVNISYDHCPEVGIESGLRKDLNSQSDYDKLFEQYRISLSDTVRLSGIEKIIKLYKQYSRISLTCFECDINQCHRKPLAEEISKIVGQEDIIHL